MDLKLSKKRAIFLVGLALFIILALSNLAAEADTLQQLSGREQLLAPTVANGSFEDPISSVNNWTVTDGSVDILTQNENKAGVMIGASDGAQFIDLAKATISQEVDGFIPGQPYVLRIDYWGFHKTGGFGTLAEAKVLIDNVEVSQGLFGFDPPGIKSKEEHDWVVCNGFEFTPTTSSIEIKIDSEETGSNGLLIDNIRIIQGSRPQPDVNPLNVNKNFPVLLTNGDLQTPPLDPSQTDENTGPEDNPHLCGKSIPGWYISRENVDMVNGFGDKSTGDWVTDTGGHGPGSLAHTIGGLEENASYTLQFEAGMHIHWGPGPMRAGFVSNGEYIKEIVRTSDQGVDDGSTYPKEFIDLTSDENGEITFEIFSSYVIENGKQVYLGGNIAYDNFKIIKKQDPPTVTTPSDQANNDAETVSLAISASDSDEDDLTFSATGLPTGLSIQKVDNENAIITGTITAAGTFQVEVTVDDGGRSSSAEFDWVVNGLPEITSIGKQSNNVSDSISLAAAATDPEDDTVTFSAVGLPPGLSIEESGLISGTLSESGSYSVSLIATDSKNGQSSISFAWDVNNVPVLSPVGDQLTPPGTSVNLQLLATDSDDDNLTFSHTTALPDGLSMDVNGKITGIVTKLSNSSVTVTVSDGNGGEDEETFTWSVNSLPTLTSPGDQRTEQGGVVSLGLTAADSDGNLIEFAASGLPTGLSINKNSGSISGTASTTGSFVVVVTVTDSYGGTTEINFNWEVYAQTPPTGEGDHKIFLPIILN